MTFAQYFAGLKVETQCVGLLAAAAVAWFFFEFAKHFFESLFGMIAAIAKPQAKKEKVR